jgi:hypothetical protein
MEKYKFYKMGKEARKHKMSEKRVVYTRGGSCTHVFS